MKSLYFTLLLCLGFSLSAYGQEAAAEETSGQEYSDGAYPGPDAGEEAADAWETGEYESEFPYDYYDDDDYYYDDYDDDDYYYDDDDYYDDDYYDDDEPPSKRQADAWIPSEVPALSTGRRDSRKFFELGLLDVNLSGAVSGVTLQDVLDLTSSGTPDIKFDTFKSLAADIDLFSKPLYAKFPVKDLFVLDVFTGIEAKMDVGLPEETVSTLKTIISNVTGLKDGVKEIADISFSDDDDDIDDGYYNKIEKIIKGLQSDINGLFKNMDGITDNEDISEGIKAGVSVFAEMGLGGSKTLLDDRLWIRAAPSVFFTILYMKQGTAGLKAEHSADDQYLLETTSSLDMYSAWDLLGGGPVNPLASPGLDLTLEACYALFPMLDIGLAVSRIPIAPSIMNYRTSINVTGDNAISFRTPSLDKVRALAKEEDFIKLISQAENVYNQLSSLEEIEYSMPEKFSDAFERAPGAGEKVRRTTRFDVYGIFKPFRTPVLVLRPNAGATVNTVFADAAFNWGMSVQYNAPRFFSASIGVGLTEGVYSNRLGIALDFRFFELDLGAALAGTTFPESWSGDGLAALVGFKFGY